ncbi:hypothetical protein HY025_03135 [Candidatus Daviesbacteria bacterium]|nr:hypothetical protein [Candidatus Daviesbacteria bacterium]
MIKLVIIVLAVLVISGVYFSKNSLAFANLRYSQATVSIPHVANTAYYNLYYKSQADKSFINGVGRIPAVATGYTITYLKKGLGYQYYITAIDNLGKQTQITPITWIQNIQNMN